MDNRGTHLADCFGSLVKPLLLVSFAAGGWFDEKVILCDV